MMVYDEAYIIARVAVNENDCWIWQACTDRLGYGQVSRKSSGESLAHRLSYRIFKGECSGVTVRHTCDNPPCCNPEHLLAGTQADNLEDARAKGRMLPKPVSKVTVEVAASIRELLLKGTKQKTIAKQLQISESHLSIIKTRILKGTYHD